MKQLRMIRSIYGNSRWLASIGPNYIAEAFLAAQKADPDAELYYNDYNIERPGKRAKALRLVHELQAAHVRLDGIGIQGHWQLDHIPFQDIEDSIVAFHRAGDQSHDHRVGLGCGSKKDQRSGCR